MCCFISGSYLVSRSRTCCLRLGIVVSASTIVQAACLAAWVAGVKRTYNKYNFDHWFQIYEKSKDKVTRKLIILAKQKVVLNFCTCRSQLLWLSLRKRGKRPSPFLDLINCFHFHTYFSNRYCLRNSAFPWGFVTTSWPVINERNETVKS